MLKFCSEYTSLSICCYALACAPNMAATLWVIHVGHHSNDHNNKGDTGQYNTTHTHAHMPDGGIGTAVKKKV